MFVSIIRFVYALLGVSFLVPPVILLSCAGSMQCYFESFLVHFFSPTVPSDVYADFLTPGFTFVAHMLVYCSSPLFGIVLLAMAIKRNGTSFLHAVAAVACVGVLITHLIVYFFEQRGHVQRVYWMRHGALSLAIGALVLIHFQRLVTEAEPVPAPNTASLTRNWRWAAHAARASLMVWLLGLAFNSATTLYRLVVLRQSTRHESMLTIDPSFDDNFGVLFGLVEFELWTNVPMVLCALRYVTANADSHVRLQTILVLFASQALLLLTFLHLESHFRTMKAHNEERLTTLLLQEWSPLLSTAYVGTITLIELALDNKRRSPNEGLKQKQT